MLSVSIVHSDAELLAWAKRRHAYVGPPPLIATTVPPARVREELQDFAIGGAFFLDLRACHIGIHGRDIGLTHPSDLILAKPFLQRAHDARQTIELLVIDPLREVNLDGLSDVINVRVDTRQQPTG